MSDVILKHNYKIVIMEKGALLKMAAKVKAWDRHSSFPPLSLFWFVFPAVLIVAYYLVVQ